MKNLIQNKIIKIAKRLSNIPVLGELFLNSAQIVQDKLDIKKSFYVGGVKLKTESLSRGNVESKEAETIISQVDDARVFYDIGACKGIFSIAAAKKYPEATIYAFEPSKDNIKGIQDRAGLNSVSGNINIIEKCIGDKDEDVNFYTHPKADGVHTTSKPAISQFDDEQISSQEASMRTIDALVEEDVLEPPTFIKIDVEGAELQVIEGAEKTIKTAEPTLLIEYHQNKINFFDSSLDELKKELNELGYSYRFIDDIHILADKK